VPEGGACINNNNECGVCVDNCGNQTDAVCRAYGYSNPGDRCSVSATGGGGRCGKGATDRSKTLVCCVVNKIYNKQDSVPPNATTGQCQLKSFVPS
jgi:hypothetical protein